jgi:hypothetical protein
MLRIVLGEREFRALVAGRTITAAQHGERLQLLLSPLIDWAQLLRAILDSRPPDPPEAGEFLRRPARRK